MAMHATQWHSDSRHLMVNKMLLQTNTQETMDHYLTSSLVASHHLRSNTFSLSHLSQTRPSCPDLKEGTFCLILSKNILSLLNYQEQSRKMQIFQIWGNYHTKIHSERLIKQQLDIKLKSRNPWKSTPKIQMSTRSERKKDKNWMKTVAYLVFGEATADSSGLLRAEVKRQILLVLVNLPQCCLLLLRNHRQHLRYWQPNYLSATN